MDAGFPAPASLIPHRPPFLFVDRVIELEPGRVITTWRADGQSAFFAGHYPGDPMMPGVLVCECALQAGALLLAHRLAPAVGTPVVTRIKDARFRRVVRPNDELRVEVVIDDEVDGVFFMTGRITVRDKLAARLEFACTLTTPPSSEA